MSGCELQGAQGPCVCSLASVLSVSCAATLESSCIARSWPGLLLLNRTVVAQPHLQCQMNTNHLTPKTAKLLVGSRQKRLLEDSGVLLSSNDVFPQVDFLFQSNGLGKILELSIVPRTL